ncbi:MAG: UDP-N-acetylmuramate dehydrogenase [Desulfobulbaceae bacterium]|nr:UDP-N-acetylmuramate dehydrogenase [Desulfobulbaceae bacterium]
MAEYCTFKVGGKAEALVVATGRTELESLMHWLRENGVSWQVIGRGSNILVQSAGFNGVIIILGGRFGAIDPVDDPGTEGQEVKVRVGAGCSVAHLVGWCARRHLRGIEFLVGIPGSIGGVVCMNAGAWGSEIGERVVTVTCIGQEGVTRTLAREQLDFSYRRLQLNKGSLADSIIVEVVLRLHPGTGEEIRAQCREYMNRRRAKQPMGAASAGSFFKNPSGDSAGRLIDAAGLKGLRRGDAMVSSRHANFIVNTGQATADDIVALMKEVQQKVYLHSGVMLEPEVHLL